jgi:thiol:disulfide interchange protein
MIAVALGGALLGGLILNIMPCVFPVIGLKAISLARGGGDERTVRREALAYAAGVILVCMALGGAMLGLRAAGHMVGWAFQLQDPRVILLMLLLLTAITANLAGVFELSSFGGGDRLTHKHGLAGSFWTGALAAFVATPCTGPFMAAALGTALVLPTVAALATFAGLGLGLALPFLALAYIPALRTRLPKPGHWMVYVRTLMAIPMGLSALGLAWLLSRQAGTTGLAIGMAAAAAVVAGLWLIGRAQRRDYGAARIGWMPITAAVVVGLATIVPVAAGEQPTGGMAHAEPFSENRLARLRAQHRPAFVYFTADWCLTCKVNEKSALETREVAHAFEQRGIAVLVGDWTNGDSAISRFLALSGRSGVPLYLYYPPGKPVPIELPQVLTIGTLLALDA